MAKWGTFTWGTTLWSTGFVTPVFDRTQADCDNKTAKGSLSVADLNRIEKNMRYIDAKLIALNYAHTFYNNTEYPWSRINYIKKTHYNNIKQSIQNMRDAFASYPGIPDLELSGDNAVVSYIEVNLIEYCLYDLKWLLDYALSTTPICGEAYCEE